MKMIFHQTPGKGVGDRVDMFLIQSKKMCVMVAVKEYFLSVNALVVDVVKFTKIQMFKCLHGESFWA